MEKTQVNKRNVRSLIKKYISDELYIELLKITFIPNSTNDEKVSLIKKTLTDYEVPFTGLGAGTNRMGILIDGYAFKIALDIDGKIDNRREMKYTKVLQPHVIKVYECTGDGLIAVTEFVEYFNLDDFHRNQNEMLEILSDISDNFLIGDVGLSTKNYANWGRRKDNSICILDFAYIYDVSYNTFKCSCEDETLLKYDNKYVNLVCPTCGKKYSFGEIRRRISRSQQEKEIGDIKNIGYNIHKDNESVDILQEFEPAKKEKQKKKKSEEKMNIKLIKYEKEREKEMSKKNSFLDYISPEEQTRNLEELDKLIYGDSCSEDVLNLLSGKKKKSKNKNLNVQINELLNYRENKKSNNMETLLDTIKLQEDLIETEDELNIEEALSDIDDMEFNISHDEIDDIDDNDNDDDDEYEVSSEAEDIEDDTPYVSNDVSRTNEIKNNGIKFKIDKELGNIEISDQKSFLIFPYLNNKDDEIGVIGCYDSDDVCEKLEILLDFIITSRYPTGILLTSEFNELDDVESYDERKFRFYRSGEYVLAYYVDMDSYNEIIKGISELDLSNNELLSLFVGMCKSCDENCSFLFDNNEFMDAAYNSDSNNRDDFIDLFVDDNETTLISDINSHPATIDVFELRGICATIIKSMTGNYDEIDDESLFGDDDETDEEDEIVDYIDLEEIDDESLFGDVDEEEDEEEDEEMKSDDDEPMMTDVVRRQYN